jgi:hypothetical protein|tara:strand:+ start:5475 stop:5954 length:480 start_codon:yes stop_codon:yes gene_type:complete
MLDMTKKIINSVLLIFILFLTYNPIMFESNMEKLLKIITIIVSVGLVLLSQDVTMTLLLVFLALIIFNSFPKTTESSPKSLQKILAEATHFGSSTDEDKKEHLDEEDDEVPPFTTPEQFNSAQSNIFNELVQDTEVRTWDDGYGPQGLGHVKDFEVKQE